MTITYADVLGTAQRLSVSLIADQDPCESDLRSVASRAYYASLHAAMDALPLDLQPSEAESTGKSSHQAVIDAVIRWSKSVRPGRTEAIFVARNLTRLKQVRKKADYFIQQDFSVTEAKTALHVAVQTVANAERAGQKAKVVLTA